MKDKKDKKETIVCRCQDISLDEVEEALEQGICDPEELKRFLHIGMGPCQGRTCGRLVSRLIMQKTGPEILHNIALKSMLNYNHPRISIFQEVKHLY